MDPMKLINKIKLYFWTRKNKKAFQKRKFNY